MTYTLKNDRITVQVAGTGGELRSIRTADGTEYLWQPDPAFWVRQAPHLFPFVGRLMEGRYLLDGESYELGCHGFFRDQELTLLEQTGESVLLGLTENQGTLAVYPRPFCVRLGYRLAESRVEILFQVENTGEKPMAFGYGGHPGFFVPLEEGLAFEDYCLDFGESCQPLQVGMSDACFIQGPDTPYPLTENRYLPLTHDLFDRDAIILKNTPSVVTLRSRKGRRGVTVSYPGMPYLGIWHKPKAAAPYVCLEPWVSLPGRQDLIEDFGEKPDLVRLAPGEVYENRWSIRVF